MQLNSLLGAQLHAKAAVYAIFCPGDSNKRLRIVQRNVVDPATTLEDTNTTMVAAFCKDLCWHTPLLNELTYVMRIILDRVIVA